MSEENVWDVKTVEELGKLRPEQVAATEAITADMNHPRGAGKHCPPNTCKITDGNWKTPDWMEQFRSLFQNTGGDTLENIMNDDINYFAHPLRAGIIMAVQSQVNLLALLAVAGSLNTTEGVKLISQEREKQLARWSPEHDDEHAETELVQAAVAYACYGTAPLSMGSNRAPVPLVWPFEAEAWKPGSYTENLAKAGALIAAEIERVQRHVARTKEKIEGAAELSGNLAAKLAIGDRVQLRCIKDLDNLGTVVSVQPGGSRVDIAWDEFKPEVSPGFNVTDLRKVDE